MSVNYISIKNILEASDKDALYAVVPFYKNGKPLTFENSVRGRKVKRWGMTVLKGGTMRFRWNEKNENHEKVFKHIINDIHKPVCSGNCGSSESRCDCKYIPVPLELIHSKTVYKIEKAVDTKELKGDGMITDNQMLVPSVTVGDCVPLFFYDDVKGVFGCVHSGWKGTGIIGEAIKMAVKDYGCSIENICVAIGPHIESCCYAVDEERNKYFTENFGPECISAISENELMQGHENLKYRLSLTEANLAVIRSCGVKDENIVVAEDCTCCTSFNDGKNVFGSFRRQAAFLPPEVDADTRSRAMTVQAAFVI